MCSQLCWNWSRYLHVHHRTVYSVPRHGLSETEGGLFIACILSCWSFISNHFLLNLWVGGERDNYILTVSGWVVPFASPGVNKHCNCGQSHIDPLVLVYEHHQFWGRCRLNLEGGGGGGGNWYTENVPFCLSKIIMSKFLHISGVISSELNVYQNTSCQTLLGISVIPSLSSVFRWCTTKRTKAAIISFRPCTEPGLFNLHNVLCVVCLVEGQKHCQNSLWWQHAFCYNKLFNSVYF